MQGYFGRDWRLVGGSGGRYRGLCTRGGARSAGGAVPHSTLEPFDPPQEVLDQLVTLPELLLKVLDGWFARLRPRGRFDQQDYGGSGKYYPPGPALQPAPRNKKFH